MGKISEDRWRSRWENKRRRDSVLETMGERPFLDRDRLSLNVPTSSLSLLKCKLTFWKEEMITNASRVTKMDRGISFSVLLILKTMDVLLRI